MTNRINKETYELLASRIHECKYKMNEAIGEIEALEADIRESF